MSELQVGGLAMVIGCLSNPRHIGKVVEIISAIPEGHGVSIEGAIYYCSGGDGFVCSGHDVSPHPDHKYGSFAKKHLIPIKPSADPLDVTNKEELHA